MAVVAGERLELGMKAIGTSASVPNDYVARLMYYLKSKQLQIHVS